MNAIISKFVQSRYLLPITVLCGIILTGYLFLSPLSTDRLWLLVSSVVLFMMGAGASLGTIYWKNSAEGLRMKREAEKVLEKNTVEEKLRESEQTFRALVDSGQALVWMAGTDKLCYYFNSVWLQFTGRTLEMEQGNGWAEGVHPDDLQRCLDIYVDAFDQRVSFGMEYRLRRHDGEYRWIIDDGSPRYDTKGGFLGYIGHCLDITERKNAEFQMEVALRTLRVSEQRLKEAQAIARVGSYVLDITTGSWTSSEMLDGIFGIDEHYDRSPEGWSALLPPEWRDKMTHYLVNDVIGSKQRFDLEYPIIRKDDGSLCWVHGHGQVEYGADGQPLTMVGTIQDISERKQSEDKLQKLAEDLKRSNVELEQFAYIASHDLQEPLRMISSYTQLLEKRYKDKLDDDANVFIGFAVDGANRMQSMIKSFLAYSRATRDRSPLQQVDFNTVIDDVRLNLQIAIRETGAVITADRLPTLAGNPTLLVQLFQNLIGNAMKFQNGEAPRIHVSATRKGMHWTFAVKDNGIGIDPQYFEKIFMMFQRLHTPGEYPGTGIGLSVCKNIVERHGGTIWVASEPGQGTTFFFTIAS